VWLAVLPHRTAPQTNTEENEMTVALKTVAKALLSAYDRDEPTERLFALLRESIEALDTKLSDPQRILLAALHDGPKRVSDLDLPINKLAINHAMKTLLQRKLIHIQSYIVGMGPSSRILALGMNPSEKRAVSQQSEDFGVLVARHERQKAVRRARRKTLKEQPDTPTKVKPRRDPAAAWF